MATENLIIDMQRDSLEKAKRKLKDQVEETTLFLKARRVSGDFTKLQSILEYVLIFLENKYESRYNSFW